MENFLTSYVLNRTYKNLTVYVASGQNHIHDLSTVVVGITLFDSVVEGPGSTSSFSMKDFMKYQKKIDKCKESVRKLFVRETEVEEEEDEDDEVDEDDDEDKVEEEEEDGFNMYSIANDCQCCS